MKNGLNNAFMNRFFAHFIKHIFHFCVQGNTVNRVFKIILRN